MRQTDVTSIWLTYESLSALDYIKCFDKLSRKCQMFAAQSGHLVLSFFAIKPRGFIYKPAPWKQSSVFERYAALHSWLRGIDACGRSNWNSAPWFHDREGAIELVSTRKWFLRLRRHWQVRDTLVKWWLQDSVTSMAVSCKPTAPLSTHIETNVFISGKGGQLTLCLCRLYTLKEK